MEAELTRLCQTQCCHNWQVGQNLTSNARDPPISFFWAFWRMMLYAKRGRKRKHLLAFVYLHLYWLHSYACAVSVCNVNEAKCDEKGRKASSLIYSDLKKLWNIIVNTHTSFDTCMYLVITHIVHFFRSKHRFSHTMGEKVRCHICVLKIQHVDVIRELSQCTSVISNKNLENA